MHIATSQLEQYCKKLGKEINIQVDLEDTDMVLRLVAGNYETYSNTAVFLSGQEILKLLELNDILGENGQVNKILNSSESNKDKQIDDLVYTTTAQYVIQMLYASTGMDLAPKIKALPQHKEPYFRRFEQ